jgi:hypothetical protein
VVPQIWRTCSGPSTSESLKPSFPVGWITLLAGLSDFAQAFYLMAARPAPLGGASVLISGLVIFYASFFTFLGITEIRGLDLRPLGNVAFAVALVPLPYRQVFSGGWMFRSILAVWVIAFLSIAAPPTASSTPSCWAPCWSGETAIYFWPPAWILAAGNTIP